jgi:hypothetical protein
MRATDFMALTAAARACGGPASTGEHGVGGRLATRSSDDGSLPGAPPGLLFDHAAQFFTADHPAFLDMVRRWEADGAVGRWEGPVGTLRSGAFTPDLDGPPRYVARGGMRRLAQYLAGQASQALRQSGSGKADSTEGEAQQAGCVQACADQSAPSSLRRVLSLPPRHAPMHQPARSGGGAAASVGERCGAHARGLALGGART